MQDSKTATKQHSVAKEEEIKKSEMQNRLDDRINKLIALHVKALIAAENSNERNTVS